MDGVCSLDHHGFPQSCMIERQIRQYSPYILAHTQHHISTPPLHLPPEESTAEHTQLGADSHVYIASTFMVQFQAQLVSSILAGSSSIASYSASYQLESPSFPPDLPLPLSLSFSLPCVLPPQPSSTPLSLIPPVRSVSQSMVHTHIPTYMQLAASSNPPSTPKTPHTVAIQCTE